MGKITKAVFTGIAIAVGTLAFVGCAKNENALDQYNANDQDIVFAKAASVGHYGEIELSKVDTSKGVDSAGKAYGRMIINDHNTADSLLKTIANPIGLSTPDTLDDAHRALRAYLYTVSGRTFDSAYIKNMVADHNAAIALYTKEAQDGQYFQLKLYATNMLPILQRHLDEATVIASQY